MRPLTVHDYRAVPEGGPRYQLIEGEMHMAPAPNRFRQHISRNIEFILLKYLEKNPIGEVRIHVYFLQKNAETPAATCGAKAKFKSPLFPGLTFDTARIFKF